MHKALIASKLMSMDTIRDGHCISWTFFKLCFTIEIIPMHLAICIRILSQTRPDMFNKINNNVIEEYYMDTCIRKKWAFC